MRRLESLGLYATVRLQHRGTLVTPHGTHACEPFLVDAVALNGTTDPASTRHLIRLERPYHQLVVVESDAGRLLTNIEHSSQPSSDSVGRTLWRFVTAFCRGSRLCLQRGLRQLTQ